MATIIPGDGDQPCDIMVCGERPGREEYLARRGFVGPAGEELWHWLWLRARIDRDGTESGLRLWVTNLVKTFSMEPPTPAEIARDSGVLRAELLRARPRLIVAVGAYAARWFLPQFADVLQEVWHGLAFPFTYGRVVQRTAVVVPIIHSAAALRQPERYQNLFASDCRAVRQVWDQLDQSQSPYHMARRPAVFRIGLAQFGREGLTLGVDTEGTPAVPECVALASSSRHACVIEVGDGGQTSKFLAPALRHAGRIFIHAALGDHQILNRLGIALDADRLDDTMIMAALLGLPQGLKTLAYRELGYEMQSYEDLVTPIDNHLVRTTLERIYAEERESREYRRHRERRRHAARKAEAAQAKQAARRAQKPIARQTAKGQTTHTPQQRAGDARQHADGSRTPDSRAGKGAEDFPSRALTSLHRILTTTTAAEDTLRKRWSRSTFASHVPLPPPATWRSAPPDDRMGYVMTDAVAHLAVGKLLRRRIADAGLMRVYRIDRGVLPLLSRSEQIGMAVDKSAIEQLSATFKIAFNLLVEQIESMAGFAVNPLSGEQVSDCLFDNLGIDPTKRTKSGKHFTTADKYLKARKLQHLIIPKILEARQINKYVGTYTEKLPSMLQEDAQGAWRYHPDWRYTRTATGRLAETIILLIPKHSPRAKMIRNGFYATDGHTLVSVDLSQIELRVMADVSGDEHLLKAYHRGDDLHAQVAHELLGAPKGKANQDESLHRLPAKCFHPDTEVLTRSGWKRIAKLADREEVIQAHPNRDGEVSLSWAIPTEVYTTRHPSCRLIHLKNEGIDLRVTPDHRMLGWRASGEWFVAPPEKFATAASYWANSGVLRGQNRRPKANSFVLRLAVALQADGNITEWNSVRWAFSKKRKADRLRILLDAAHIPFKEAIHKNGTHGTVQAFAVTAGAARSFVQQLDHKMLPWSWLDLPEWARKVVLEEAAYWDSHRHSDRLYSFCSFKAQNLDVLQALAAITGRKTRRGERAISVKRQSGSRGGNVQVTTQRHTDVVACLAVPSSFVLVRDRGITLIVGQTMNFGIINGMTEYGILDQLHEAGQLQWDIDMVMEMREGWFKLHKGVARFWREEIAHGRREGYIVNKFGRRRYLAGLRSGDRYVRTKTEREALFSIQSTADDISKVWNARIWQTIIKPRLGEGGATGRRYCEWWCRIHDDTTLEVDTRIARTVQAEMLACVPQMLCIPTTAEGKRGSRWGDLH